MTATAVAADVLPAASVAVTTKRFEPAASGTPIDHEVAVAASCCEPARVSPASRAPLAFASTHARTSVPAAAVPEIVVVAFGVDVAFVGLLTTGAAGAVRST